MPAPSDIRAQVDPILTEFAIGYRPAGNLIGKRVAPVVPVLTRTGTIYQFGKEGFRVHNSTRAARAHPKQLEFALGSDSYATAEHALSTQLDLEKEIGEARRVGGRPMEMRLERKATMMVQHNLELELEKAVADSVFADGNYESGNKVTLAGADQWKDSAGDPGTTSNPISDIREGINAARDDMGVRPNKLVFGYEAWDSLIDHPDILERIKYSERAVITEAMIAQLFNVREVMVGESVYSADGNVFTDIWGDKVACLFDPPDADLVEGTTPHTVIFELSGYPIVKTYDDAINRNYLVFREYQVKLVSNAYGYLIQDVRG